MSVTTGVNRCGMPSYTDNSSIFGSTIISRTCSGCDLYSRLRIMALMATDLPDPVVPAINKCGIRARSATTELPPMSLPKANVNGDARSSYARDLRISPRVTISRISFGISKPTKDLPGITSTTRTLTTDNDRAMSLDRFDIWLTFTPGAGSSSKRVMTGPGDTDFTSTSTPKSFSLISTRRDIPSSDSTE